MLEDFVRWYSPNDWILGKETQEEEEELENIKELKKQETSSQDANDDTSGENISRFATDICIVVLKIYNFKIVKNVAHVLNNLKFLYFWFYSCRMPILGSRGSRGDWGKEEFCICKSEAGDPLSSLWNPGYRMPKV